MGRSERLSAWPSCNLFESLACDRHFTSLFDGPMVDKRTQKWSVYARESLDRPIDLVETAKERESEPLMRYGTLQGIKGRSLWGAGMGIGH